MVDYAHEVQTYFRLLWKYGKLIKPNRREFGDPEPRSPSRTHSHTRSRSHSTGPIPSQKSENTIQDLALLSRIQPSMKRYVDQWMSTNQSQKSERRSGTSINSGSL